MHQHAKFRRNRSISCEDIKSFRFFKMAAAVILNCWICKILFTAGVRRGHTQHYTKFHQNRFFVAEIMQFFKFSIWPRPPSWIFEIVKFYWLLRWRGSRLISVPNLFQISQSVAKILRFFDFSRWRPPQSRIFKFVKFYWLTVSWGPRHITIPNFLEISHSIAEILRSFEFSSWPPPPSWIFEISKFYCLLGWRGPRRISVPNFVKIGRFVVDILKFFEFSRWPPPPSWIFEIGKFYWLFWSRTSRRIRMPNFLEICQSVAKILRFFDFSRWRPSAILDSFGAHSEYPQWVLAGLYHYAKFGYDRCSSCYNMNISIFDTFGWRMLIHAPKIGVFWQFDPQNGVQYQRKPKKANPCVSPRHLKY